MQRGHFEALRPVCPRCRSERREDVPLALYEVLEEHDGDVLFGRLTCTSPDCLLEFPVIDGIPLLFPDVRRYVADNLPHLTARQDLPPMLESLLGDCAGPGTLYDATRQHLSTYGWDHYGDADAPGGEPPSGDEPAVGEPASGSEPAPGAVVRCLDAALALSGEPPAAPALDLGCAAGRSSFELARQGAGLVLGVDVSFALLQLARRVLTEGVVVYPRRRVGIVYDRRQFAFRPEAAGRVDFWACDAQAPPFRDGSFGTVAGLNVLDCLGAPYAGLTALRGLLRVGGTALLSTPWDWSAQVTPPEGWLGGHSQRGPAGGDAEPLLRALLTPGAHPQALNGLEIAGEIEAFPWHTRLHARSVTRYLVHVLALRRTAAD